MHVGTLSTDAFYKRCLGEAVIHKHIVGERERLGIGGNLFENLFFYHRGSYQHSIRRVVSGSVSLNRFVYFSAYSYELWRVFVMQIESDTIQRDFLYMYTKCSRWLKCC